MAQVAATTTIESIESLGQIQGASGVNLRDDVAACFRESSNLTLPSDRFVHKS